MWLRGPGVLQPHSLSTCRSTGRRRQKRMARFAHRQAPHDGKRDTAEHTAATGKGGQQTFRTRVYWFAPFRACEAVLSSSHPRAVSASTKSP